MVTENSDENWDKSVADSQNTPPAHTQLDEAYWQSLLNNAPTTKPSASPTSSPPPTTTTTERNQSRQALWDKAFQAQQADKIFELVVTGYNKGGVLVAWEGLPGFVPASQLLNSAQLHIQAQRWQTLKRKQHQYIRVKIIEVDPPHNRLIFSERAALIPADQRQTVWQQIDVGDKVTGTITNLTKFGVFVDLGGVEGLIHISELSWRRLQHPSQIVQPGESITVLVTEVKPHSGRIGLSRKQLIPDPWPTINQKYTVGQQVVGQVTRIESYGVFVLVEEELEGLIHTSELAEGQFSHPHNVVQPGQQVTARIITVQPQKRRLGLTLK
ncbi:MAG TPA: S1 RNA-binding domain-containing protein [Anaerolineae bacterium]|nr:S1 RNA-binding domain-containing protein [Anaerolineae bacterium]